MRGDGAGAPCQIKEAIMPVLSLPPELMSQLGSLNTIFGWCPSPRPCRKDIDEGRPPSPECKKALRCHRQSLEFLFFLRSLPWLSALPYDFPKPEPGPYRPFSADIPMAIWIAGPGVQAQALQAEFMLKMLQATPQEQESKMLTGLPTLSAYYSRTNLLAEAAESLADRMEKVAGMLREEAKMLSV